MSMESMIKDSFYKERLLQTTIFNQSENNDVDTGK